MVARAYPNRAVRLIEPFGAGGGPDLLARALAPKLSELWVEVVTVENHPGAGSVRFIEGLSPQLQTQATVDAVSDHPEQQLLAYVFGKFKESDLLGVKTEAEKMLMLAALNLVECIAETAPRLTM